MPQKLTFGSSLETVWTASLSSCSRVRLTAAARTTPVLGCDSVTCCCRNSLDVFAEALKSLTAVQPGDPVLRSKTAGCDSWRRACVFETSGMSHICLNLEEPANMDAHQWPLLMVVLKTQSQSRVFSQESEPSIIASLTS